MRQWSLWLSVFVLVSALLLPVIPAPAQQEELQGFRVSLGAFFPSKDVSRDESETWFHGNLEYTFQRGEVQESGYYHDLGVSVGYYGSGDLYNVPVLFTYTGYLSKEFFYSAGAGIGFSRRLNKDRETGFAYAVELGYNFSAGATPLALVARWNGLTGTDEEHNGFSVLASFRF